MSVWWRHSFSIERKSQTFAFVFEHRSKLFTNSWTCGCLGHFFGISVSGKGGIRLRRRKTYYLDQMDQLGSSELGEYPTYIIRLINDFYGKCIANQPFSKFCPSWAKIRLKRVRLYRRSLLYSRSVGYRVVMEDDRPKINGRHIRWGMKMVGLNGDKMID